MSRVSLFAFHPELFEHRTLALEALAAHDLHWFEHFGSVDLLHDLFGLEVCGISKKATRTLHFVSSRKHSLIGRTQMFTTVALVATEVGKRSFIKIATSAVATKRSNPSIQLTAHIYLFS